MKKITDKKLNLKLLLLLILMILPWLGLQSDSQLIPPTPSQEDLTFYEINPCKVSLAKFIKENINTTFQDHFFFRFSSSSPLSCFGLISGATLIGTDLYISIGTNPLLNLILQASFWTLLISFIKPKGEIIKLSSMPTHYISLGLASLFIYVFIFVEKRFYQASFYQLDIYDRRYAIILVLVSFFVVKNLIETCIPRISELIYFLPASYFFIGVIDGFNTHFFSYLFIYFGFISLINLNKFSKTYLYVILTTLFWVMNSAYTGTGFYFQPGKLRGFTSSVYSFYATFAWSVFFLILVKGILYIYNHYIKEFKIEKFTRILALTSIPLVMMGYIGANFPIFNAFNYYYFGQQKYGVTLKNPFFFNEWSEKVSWRGFYPSAETIGEYYGLVLIFLYIVYKKGSKISIYEISGGIFALGGLYFSDNRAALVFFVFTIIYFETLKLGIKIRLLFLTIFTIFFLYIVGFQNLGYEYEFMSNSVIDQANGYQLSEESSFLQSLNEGELTENSSMSVFKFFSAGGYLLNRGEVWGVFSSRYNPTYLELLFGSGPLNFGQLYGEIDIKPTRGTLLPHSSLLSFIVFIGIFGILLVSYKFIKYFKKNNINSFGLIIFVYLIANIIKNDSLNYFPTFILYSVLFYIVLNLDNKKIFQ